jgi:hypothetical protein
MGGWVGEAESSVGDEVSGEVDGSIDAVGNGIVACDTVDMGVDGKLP